MGEEKSTDVGTVVSDKVLLDQYVSAIQNSLNSIVNNFFVVGKILANIQEKKLYNCLGYESLMIFSLDKFNLSRNQTYNFINIYKKFNDKKFGDFNYSQLTEMLSLPSDKLEEITPTMTVKEIREVKSIDKEDKIKFGKQTIIDVPVEEQKEEQKEKQLNRKELLDLYLNKVDESATLRTDFKNLSNENEKLKNEIEKLKKENEKLKKSNDKYKNTNLKLIESVKKNSKDNS